MPTGSCSWCGSRMPPRSWRARAPERPSRRSRGARAARRSPSARRTARPASSIWGDGQSASTHHARRALVGAIRVLGLALLLLWRGATARRGARALGGERVIGQPVPDLALPEQRNAEIAAHLELLAVRADAHQRAIDRAVARIQDGPVLVRQSIAPHAFDHRQAEHRFASVCAFAPVASPVLVLA